jgi:sarcosine oxidase subunit beta
MSMAEVVVVGGGAEGCSIAYHLAMEGVRVTLVERWEIGAAASGASAGGVRQQGRDLREFPLAFRAIERWRTLETELAADLGYRRGGHLTTIEDIADLPALADSIAAQAATGLEIRLVQGDELRSIVPGIGSTVIAGAYTPNDGHANPGATTRAFAAAAARRGARPVTGRRVTGIAVEAGRVHGVETDAGSIAADVVVLAAGAWSAGLAAPLEIALPLTPQGFQAMTTTPAPAQLTPVMGSVRRMISLKQLPDGRYLLGGGWPGAFDLSAPRGQSIPENQQGNREAAIGILPAVAAVEIAEAWLGIEAVAADEVPIIGPVAGIDGLVVAAGFSGHGFALSPVVGERVATLITSGTVPPELADLSLARFANGTPSVSVAGQRTG